LFDMGPVPGIGDGDGAGVLESWCHRRGDHVRCHETVVGTANDQDGSFIPAVSAAVGVTRVPGFGQRGDDLRPNVRADVDEVVHAGRGQIGGELAADCPLPVGAAAEGTERFHRLRRQAGSRQRHGCHQHQAAGTARSVGGDEFGDLRAHALPHEYERLSDGVDHRPHVGCQPVEGEGSGLDPAGAHAGQVELDRFGL